MKASLNWLSRYVDIKDLEPEEIAKRLTFAGVESDGISHLASGTNLVIGEILDCKPHPDSDHLHVLQVDLGKKHGVVQIVCGAPNARKGLKVIVAMVGAELPEITIKKGVIRGVESNGMCCSLPELGVDKKYLSESQVNGIEELPEDAPVGEEDVLGYLGLDDTVIDLDLLANRPDLYAVMNIAREVGALFEREVHLPEPKKHELEDTDFHVGSETKNCPMFSLRIMRGIKTKPSPKWMSSLLEAEGVRSINNVVDIGNFIMLLTGQPLNMYDLDKLPEPSLVVRDDYEGDFLAMDGKTYALKKGDLCVMSGNRVMCLGGVMTSEECKVDEKSENIAIEVAYFAGAPIRHTSNRLGLVSDSSQRFVKGVNPDQAEYVQSLSTDLLFELGEAKSCSKTALFDTLRHDRKVVETTLAYLNDRLGTSFSLEEVKETLKRDYFELIHESNGEMTYLVPSFRIDIDGQADLSEELIRLKGYDCITSSLPTSELHGPGFSKRQKQRRGIRAYLRGIGLDEALTYTLVSGSDLKRFAYLEQGEANRLLNPLTADREYVRINLLPSLLGVASYNLARQNEDFALFEASDVDPKGKKGMHVSAIMVGNRSLQGALSEKPYDFYDAKGVVEGILSLLGLGKNRYQIVPWSLGGDGFHPGKAAELRFGKRLVGVLGELHPSILKELGVKHAAAFELDLDFLLSQQVSMVKASIPPQYPSSERDIAIIIDETVPYEQVEKAIRKATSLIRGVSLFDVYQGEHVASGKKSLAIRLSFQSEETTLREEEVNDGVRKVLTLLSSSFGAEIRK